MAGAVNEVSRDIDLAIEWRKEELSVLRRRRENSAKKLSRKSQLPHENDRNIFDTDISAVSVFEDQVSYISEDNAYHTPSFSRQQCRELEQHLQDNTGKISDLNSSLHRELAQSFDGDASENKNSRVFSEPESIRSNAESLLHDVSASGERRALESIDSRLNSKCDRSIRKEFDSIHRQVALLQEKLRSTASYDYIQEFQDSIRQYILKFEDEIAEQRKIIDGRDASIQSDVSKLNKFGETFQQEIDKLIQKMTEIDDAVHKVSHMDSVGAPLQMVQQLQHTMKEQENRINHLHSDIRGMVNENANSPVTEIKEKTGTYYWLHVILRSFVLIVLMMNLLGKLCIPERIS